jgi:hypothetical protein
MTAAEACAAITDRTQLVTSFRADGANEDERRVADSSRRQAAMSERDRTWVQRT